MIKITTTARRIARELNTTPKEYNVYFDENGRVVDTEPADMQFLPGKAPDNIKYGFRGRRFEHVTYREIQESMNEQG